MQLLMMISLLFASGLAKCQTPAESVESGQPLVLASARVFDGHELIERTNVLVIDGKIAQIGDGDRSKSAAQRMD